MKAALKGPTFDNFRQWEYFPRVRLGQKDGRRDIWLAEAWEEYCKAVGDEGGHKVKVNITDTGVDTTHPALKNHIAPALEHHVSEDTQFHGTHVAGTVMMSPDWTYGLVGVNSYTNNNITLVPVSTVRNRSTYASIIQKLEMNIQQNIRVSNHSYGIDLSGKAADARRFFWESTFEKLHLNNHLMVASAGNASLHLNKQGLIHFPCCHESPSIICVGNMNMRGEVNRSSNYSKHYVDVFAPGTNIISTKPGNSYRRLSGTSMASPIVAGIAAMLISMKPDLTSVEVKRIIMDNVDKTDDFETTSKSGGHVNAYRAVKEVSELLKSKSMSLSDDDDISLQITASLFGFSSSISLFTMVWLI